MRPRTDWEGATDTAWDTPVNGADYDALADLFLAGAQPAETPPVPPVPLVSPKPANGAAPKAAPIPSPVTPREEAAEPVASHARGATIEPIAHAPTPGAARAGCDVEALVLGHLPAMTGAWVTQHAREAAGATGVPVALVRITAGLASVELIGAPPGTHSPGSPRPSCATIEEAIGVAAASAGRFMVRVEATEEPGLCATEGVAAITLLTGADEPASLAAYGAVKAMLRPADSEGSPDSSALAPEDASSDESGALRRPALRVVFMGSSEDDARAAGAKIRAAARAFLGADVEIGVGASHLGPTPSVALFRGRANAPTRSIVAAVIAAARSVSGALHARRATEAPDVASPRIASSHTQAASASDLDGTMLVEPSNASTPVHRSTDAAGPTIAVSASARHGAQAPPEASAPPCPASLPGALLLPLHSPDAPGVSFARDDEGRLHLVCKESPDAVARLLAAKAWAARHGELLALALRGAGAPAVSLDQPVGMHLLTERPSRWAGLRHTEIRVRAVVHGASVEVS